MQDAWCMACIARSQDETYFFFLYYAYPKKKNKKNNNHKLDTWTFSERSKYINVLNSRFALNHRGKNVLNRPSNLRFRSIVVIMLYIIHDTLWYYYGALLNAGFDIIISSHISSRYIVFQFNTRSHWPVKRRCVVGF